MNRLLTLSCLLVAAVSAAPAGATTDIFDGNPAPLNVQLSGSGIPVTLSGGQLLYRALNLDPDLEGALYGTTSRLPGYSNPLTFSFGQAVTAVRVIVFNIAPTRILWNGAQITPGGIRQITFPGPLTELSVEAFNLDALFNPTTDWDFAILRVTTDQGELEFPAVTPPPAPAGATLVKIADADTPLPGGGGTFGNVATQTSISDGIVAFHGQGSVAGIYAGSGGPTAAIADITTAIPGGSGTFTSFGDSVRVGSTTAFVGEAPPQQGIYIVTDGGPLAVVADRNTPTPDGTGTLAGFRELGFSGTAVAFNATSPEGSGLYTDLPGPLTKIARRDEPTPGSPGAFDTFLGVPAVAETFVAFRAAVDEPDGMGGTIPREGIFRFFSGGSLERAVDQTTPIPGGTGTFTSFGSIDAQGDGFYFIGRGDGGQIGIYHFTEDSISRVVDTNTPIPGGAFGFTSFTSVAVSGAAIAFHGSGLWGQGGVFLLLDGVVRALLRNNNPLDETHVAAGLDLRPASLHGADVAVGGVYSRIQGRGVFRVSVEPLCGDGVVGGDEQCDDGNLADGDGCSATCVIEGDPCGDGDLDPGEECDDGNNQDGDGCSADCRVEDFCTQMCARPEALHVGQSNAVLVGTPGDDILCGDDRANSLRGNNRNDVLCGFGGDDRLRGEQGDDVLDGGEGDDVLRGDAGDDSLHGGNGRDRLDGRQGADELHGGPGDDLLRGGSGDDVLDGDDDVDRVYGEAGADACTGELVVSCEGR